MDQGFNVFYRERIIDMVSQIRTEQFLVMIYGFVSVCYGQEDGEDSRYKELEDLVMQHHPEGSSSWTGWPTGRMQARRTFTGWV